MTANLAIGPSRPIQNSQFSVRPGNHKPPDSAPTSIRWTPRPGEMPPAGRAYPARAVAREARFSPLARGTRFCGSLGMSAERRS